MSMNILLLCGGDGAEHSVSVRSADFIEQKLAENPDFRIIRCTLHNHGFETPAGRAWFNADAAFCCGNRSLKIDCAVPCLHGYPGETGDIQSLLEFLNIPYIGCGSEASRNCFNKITTKLYLNALGIPNSPFAAIARDNETGRQRALEFFDHWQDIYVKAASQGSSVGCYHVRTREEVLPRLTDAFKYSTEVLLEKNIRHRELETAAYELNKELIVTRPGEIIMPENVFYTYEEKYSDQSGTTTTTEPEGLTEDTVQKLQELARLAFTGLKLRDLSRIDFFLSEEDGLLINEINTFPGQTSISMFPKLLEHHGDSMCEFLTQAIGRAMARRQI